MFNRSCPVPLRALQLHLTRYQAIYTFNSELRILYTPSLEVYSNAATISVAINDDETIELAQSNKQSFSDHNGRAKECNDRSEVFLPQSQSWSDGTKQCKISLNCFGVKSKPGAMLKLSFYEGSEVLWP